MCGIVGQVRQDSRGVDRELLERMCTALEHRGPDSRGTHTNEAVGLGIQRLRVIDIETGDQPIFNEHGSVVVVLNGEIYNYRELRSDLERRGHVFATQGDTEVIAHLYEELGTGCVPRLHGMFAFALWDATRRRLLLARDRVGKKPLFYCARDEAFSFASELGALMQDPEIRRELDHTALDCFLAHSCVPAPRSVFRAVRKLPPAHTLVLEHGRVVLERYWRLDYSRKRRVTSLAEVQEEIREAIRRAVRRRMVADVPLGAFLSGGIDSSAVVAAMAEASSVPVKTFSIGFDRAAHDELPYARLVARRFATEHHEFVVRPEAIEVLPAIVRHHGEPFGDSSAVPSFQLAALTRDHVTVALNGDGGDESFGGYTRYVANVLAGRLDALPSRLRRFVSAAGTRLPAGGDVSSPLNRARRLALALALDPPARYGRYVTVLDGPARRRLYNDEYADLVDLDAADEVIAAPWRDATGSATLDRMLEVDAVTYLPDDLIAKVDIATMAHGLEARSPLLDHELMELAASLPADLKVRGREKKWILREALRPWLPPEILDRPKQGFSIPLNEWFRDDLRDHVRDVLLDRETLGRAYFREDAVRRLVDEHAAGVDAHAPSLWNLLVLELWHREFVDGVPRVSSGRPPAFADARVGEAP